MPPSGTDVLIFQHKKISLPKCKGCLRVNFLSIPSPTCHFLPCVCTSMHICILTLIFTCDLCMFNVIPFLSFLCTWQSLLFLSSPQSFKTDLIILQRGTHVPFPKVAEKDCCRVGVLIAWHSLVYSFSF